MAQGVLLTRNLNRMTKVSEQRMKLRIEYSRETDLIFSDNIPAYADWLEQKLALRQPPVIGSVCTCRNSELEKGSLVPVFCHTCNAYVQTDI